MEQPIKVLVVEDQLIIALMIEQMVERMGHVVVGKVASGEDAIEVARRCSPDLILMDIRLEGELDGIEAMQEIQREGETPVIFISGNSDEMSRKRVKEINRSSFLVKPLTYSELNKYMDLAS